MIRSRFLCSSSGSQNFPLSHIHTVKYCDGNFWSAETMATEQVRGGGVEGGREGRNGGEMTWKNPFSFV